MREIIYRQCTAAADLHQVFIDDDGDEQMATVDDCTCDMYHMNGTCEHIDVLRERVCTWRSNAADAMPPDPDHPSKCPVCGADAVVVMR